MHTTLLLLSALALAACGSAPESTPPVQGAPGDAPPDASGPSDTPLVVAELFTSEGCSSCPPADRLLTRLTREAETSGSDLLTLSYHVDYWDRLGWADPFGSPVHSARQRAYAQTFDGRVYTPQLIVGGTDAFVGSRERQARRAVAAAEAQSQPVAVELVARADGSTVTVDYVAEAPPEGARIHLLLVQREGRSDVRRGENRGRSLDHVHIVRGVQTREAGTGTGTLSVPDGLDTDDVFVAALVQSGRVGAVLGAARAEISAEPRSGASL